MTNPPTTYENWTREELIARLVQLDDAPKLNIQHPSTSSNSKKLSEKPFDFASYTRRKIALKFCYSGWEYNGLAHQLGPTPLPTVEGTLFDALAHARLIDPNAGFEGCGWERCGRTDRGVSAAGQVVSLWVRSAKKEAEELARDEEQSAPSQDGTPQASDTEASNLIGDLGLLDGDMAETSNTSISSHPNSKPISELRYVSILNRVLPPTIRVLAWCPVSSTFSSRFNCQFRHYKYFFDSKGLDISLMRDGASRLVGEHDFRNLCKLDPAKQITSFKRRILRADLSPIGGRYGEDTYVLDLVGTAFLYHQVRHIMAILFMVGTGVEHPSVVSALMNVTPGAEQAKETDPSPLEIVDRKPEYQMADGLPLMLWDCGYSDADIQWQTDNNAESSSGSDNGTSSQQGGTGANLYHELECILARSTTHNILDAHFLEAAARYHSPPTQHFPLSSTNLDLTSIANNQEPLNIHLGGGTFKRMIKYIPLLQRKRLDSVDVANERWRIGKGLRREERRRGIEEDDGGNE